MHKFVDGEEAAGTQGYHQHVKVELVVVRYRCCNVISATRNRRGDVNEPGNGNNNLSNLLMSAKIKAASSYQGSNEAGESNALVLPFSVASNMSAEILKRMSRHSFTVEGALDA